jgi:hypothetical protein
MSGEKVPYHLRQNKYVDRQLFVDVLWHINRVRPIKNYLYVGFGGAYLEDFKIIHANFGNKNMLSLEQEPWVYARQKLNIPYGCVHCENKTSSQFLENYDLMVSHYNTSNVLVWLDYAEPVRTKLLNEFQALVRHMKAYDVVKLTLNANPRTLGEERYSYPPETAEELRARRFEKMRARLGEFLPEGSGPEQVTPEGYVRILLGCVRFAALQALAGSPELVLQPIALFTYQDAQHQMLTATSVVLPRDGAQQFLEDSGLSTYEFATTLWDRSVNINLPYLSAREKLYLDQLLFKSTRKSERTHLIKGTRLKTVLAKEEADSQELVRQYLLFYRQYPHYHLIQY